MYDNTQRRNLSSLDSLESQTDASSASTSIPPFVAASMGSYVFETGKQKARQMFNIYSHIDYLRPYFDVEPKDVLNRLLKSVIPIEYNYKLQNELYGPLMLIFTLAAILIYQMKLANHAVQDGTLIGTAFFVCFAYWLGFSFLISSTSFIFNSSITLFNYLSLIGYSLFSNCVVLLIGTFIHTQYDHVIFYSLWFLLGGASALKLAYTIFANTPHPKYRLILALFAIFMHLAFLLYLHFAYHELAEEISHALFDKQAELPAMLQASVEQVTIKSTVSIADDTLLSNRKKALIHGRHARDLNGTTTTTAIFFNSTQI